MQESATEMPSTTAQFYLVRHGETEANYNDIIQGHCDYPLTKRGIAQTKRVGVHLKDVYFHKVYTSDLGRAQATCSNIVQESTAGLPNVVRTHLLRECRFGILEELKKGTTIEEAKQMLSMRLQIPVESIVDSSESQEELHQRQLLFLHKALDDIEQGEKFLNANNDVKILCVTHGAFIRGFLDSKLGLVIPSGGVKNCSISIVRVKRDTSGHLEFFARDPSDLNNDNHMKHLDEC